MVGAEMLHSHSTILSIPDPSHHSLRPRSSSGSRDKPAFCSLTSQIQAAPPPCAELPHKPAPFPPPDEPATPPHAPPSSPSPLPCTPYPAHLAPPTPSPPLSLCLALPTLLRQPVPKRHQVPPLTISRRSQHSPAWRLSLRAHPPHSAVSPVPGCGCRAAPRVPPTWCPPWRPGLPRYPPSPAPPP